MRLVSSLWLCFGSDYPHKFGVEFYWSEQFIGASVSIGWWYAGLEWRH